MGDTRTGRRAEQAAGGETARTLVLVGWAAKAVVYLGVAWLVYQMATGTASEEASTTGALRLIQDATGGRLVLIVLGIGLLLYAAGRVLEVTTLATGQIEKSDKAQALVMSLVYLAVAISAFTAAGISSGGGGQGGGGNSEQQGAAVLLDLPFGRILVGLVGLGVIALGAYTVKKGVKKEFLPTLRTGEMSTTVRAWSERIGVAAYVTKGLIFALLGWFLLQAAITYDSQKAVGLDGALQRVAQADWGKALLLAVAVGLLAYALFCALEARYRKVGVSAGGTA
ncbi:MAG: DUF1206 domain-containing protein [Actinomycetota bacterium]|nr:DUF1206 domain-containing protein [Actinomycetota bacterium]